MLTGFKLPEKNDGTNMCGRGLYFSVCSTYAAQFSCKDYNEVVDLIKLPHFKYLLLCELVSGKSLETTGEMPELETCPDGFQSVRGLGRYSQDPNENIVASDGALWPVAPFQKVDKHKDNPYPDISSRGVRIPAS